MTCGTKKSKLDSDSDGPGVSDDPQSVSWRVRPAVTAEGSERRYRIRWIS